MKVLYDSQIFDRQRYGGVSRYFKEIIHRMRAERDFAFDIPLLYTWNRLIPDERPPMLSVIPQLVEKHEFRGRYRVIRFLERSNRRMNIAAVRKGMFDILHPTYYDPYFLEYLGKRPYVVTVHDMMHELFPEMYARNDETTAWKRLLVEHARKVVAISENTKRDLVRLFRLPEAKIEVIYLGCSEPTASPRLDGSPMRVRYILFVGERIRYKNFRRFIRVVTPILTKDLELAVVCAGGGTFGTEEVTLFGELGIAGRVVHCALDDETLYRFYRHAECLVYPSLYEGFGLPILEAFSCGCPVAVSSTSSFPEVAGDAAAYFNPEDDNAMRETIEQVLYSGTLRNALRSHGEARWRVFSWDETSRKTRKLYDTILS